MRSRVHSRPISRCAASSSRPSRRMDWMMSSTGVARLSLRLFSISSRARSFPGRSGTILGLEYREALVRVGDIALNVGGFGWPPPELVHFAVHAHPAPELLLSAVPERAPRPPPPLPVIGG